MFVRQSWYVAAWADEIEAGQMLARTLLGQPVLLYRTDSGVVHALEDRCCHRALPLSMGCVQGDQVQCGYHGLVFEPSGACVRIPGQERIPSSARVRSYKVLEQDALVWIWMGDAERADPTQAPRHPEHQNPNWVWVKDRYRIEANYQLITDNLMDLTHVGYVHGRTIGGTPQAHSQAEQTVAETEGGVKVARFMPDSVPPPAYTAAHQFGTPRVDRWMDMDFTAPSTVRIHTGAVDTGTGAREGHREGGFAFVGFNTQTPETETSTRYFWSGARYQHPGQTVNQEQLRQSLSTTFAEDKVVVEAQQRALTQQAEPLVMIGTDTGMVRARRRVSALLAQETGDTCDGDRPT